MVVLRWLHHLNSKYPWAQVTLQFSLGLPFASTLFYLEIRISYTMQWTPWVCEDTRGSRDEQFLSLLEGSGIGDISTTGVYAFPKCLQNVFGTLKRICRFPAELKQIGLVSGWF